MDSLSIRQLTDRVYAGTLRVPAFQRGFVWDADRVGFLIDSIYKGYPFGALILWRTKSALKTERQLGPFALPEGDPDYPIDYVLDGQQRLTSIFGVFQSELTPQPGEDTAWTKIYYDFGADYDLQESQFLALADDDVDSTRHFPISTFFDPPGYRAATASLPAGQQTEIDGVQAIIKEASIPVQLIETDNRDKVAIVFERVNRLGVELDVYQLLTAWTWSEEFDLKVKFDELADELAPFGFSGVGEDSNLLLRCCSAILASDASTAGLLSLNGGAVRDRFSEIRNGIRGAIDFLKNNTAVAKLENLPFATMLVPLSVYFAAPDGKTVAMTAPQRDTLLKWFWRSCFSRRFSGGVLNKLNRDIKEIQSLKAGTATKLSDVPGRLDPEFFADNTFTIGSVNTKTFILLLAHRDALSFVDGQPVNLDEVLQTYNRTEFHHLYPRSYLKRNGYTTDQINRLANFAIISAKDNNTLGGVAPSIYQAKMTTASRAEVLEAAYCSVSLFADDYEAFIDERKVVLLDEAKKLTGW